jgi:multicomponent Na+:H+ antiporter subunit D
MVMSPTFIFILSFVFLILSIFPWAYDSINSEKIIKRNKTALTISLTFSILACILHLFSVKQICLEKIYININIFKLFETIYISIHTLPESLIFGSMFFILTPLAILYSFYYFSETQSLKPSYFVALIFSMLTTILIAYSSNLVTSYIFYEILTFSTYSLVIFKRDKVAMKTGGYYIAYLSLPAVLFLTAIAILYYYSPSLSYVNTGVIRNTAIETRNALYLFVLFLFSVSKTAVFPMHGWLPKCMSAPTPVSAILHAVAVVKSGAVIMIMITFYIFGLDIIRDITVSKILFSITSVSCIYGSIMALESKIIKKRLAYSTMAQISYILLALTIPSNYSKIATVLQLIGHSFAKLTLFFVSGIFYIKYNIKNISGLRGIAKKEQILSIAFLIASLNLIGIPPSLNFSAKYYTIIAAIHTNKLFHILVFGVSTIISFLYVSTMLYEIFFKKPSKQILRTENIHIPYFIKITILLCSLVSYFGYFAIDKIIAILT